MKNLVILSNLLGLCLGGFICADRLLLKRTEELHRANLQIKQLKQELAQTEKNTADTVDYIIQQCRILIQGCNSK